MSIRKLLVLLILVPMFVIAQSGKIAGVVSDTDTGEPLVGVNVVLDNTTMGAMTDIDGYYVILNVPANTYDIRASYIGYKDVVVEGARVSSGVTTNQNFTLTQTTLELEEAVVVRAERPLVEKNVTQSYSLVTTEQIEALPVRELNNILALQPSVVVQDGSVHIRGGRSEEVGYYLDGASTQNALTNTNAIYVITDAVEEIQVLTGGYTAEFGGANSGIIRSQLKSGTSDFHASLDFQTDKFAAEGEKFLGTYSYRHHVAVASISGPILGNKIKFYLAGENNFQGDDEIRYGKGFKFVDLIDSNPSRLQTDTVSISYPSGFTPRNERDRYALNGSITFDYNPINIRLSGTYNDLRQHIDGAPWLNILRDRQTYDDQTSYLFTLKATHILSPTTFYDVTLGAYGYDLETGDTYMGHNWKTWYDSAAVNVPGAYKNKWEAAPGYVFNGISMQREGQPINGYRHTNQNYLSGALNFTSQVGRHHEVKFGAEARLYTVRHFDITPSVMKYAADPADSLGFTTYGSIEAVPANFWQLNGDVDAYGYDLYGNETDSETNYDGGIYTAAPKEPIMGSVYLQDKIEYDDLIINAGLRFDYFDSDDRELKDPGDVPTEPGSSLIKKDQWVDVDAYTLISPRLGFSFPVNDRTVFYFQYGKFAQLPQLDQLYFSEYSYSEQIVVGGFYYQNPVGFGLEPIKTTNYEIGFRNQISDYAAIDVTGFYRNIKGQIQVVKQQATGNTISSYDRFVNGDFATTKGLELKLTLRRVNRIQAQLNYTLTDAQGTGSNSTSYRAAAYYGTPLPSITSALDYEQTHRGSINLDYRFGNNDGGAILENSGANVLFTFNSGHPYTKVNVPPGGQVSAYDAGIDYMLDTRQREAVEPLNTSTTPWNFNVDLRLDKSFNITDKLNATVYCRVNNLLDTKNVINVYSKTGNAYDDGFLGDSKASGDFVEALGQDYVDMYKAINVKNGGAYRSQLGLELFGQPRQIFFGIRLNY